MTHRLATNYAKNYCNQTLIVKVIVENVVTCFFGTRCRYKLKNVEYRLRNRIKLGITAFKDLRKFQQIT